MSSDQPFIDSLRQTLDSRAHAIDAEDAARLASARAAALQAAVTPDRTHFRVPPWRVPSWAVAGVVVLVAGLVVFNTLQFDAPSGMGELEVLPYPEDYEILMHHDDLEKFEKLDFFRWLAQNQQQT